MCMPFSKEKVSVFTACKDRNDHLVESIRSWFKVPEIKEIIIVDWSSKIPVTETLRGVLPPNGVDVRVLRVEDQPKWILTIPFNLAAHNTTYDRLLKLDCDSILKEDFVKNHRLGSKEFYCGNWRNARCKNENHLNGILYLKKKQFLAVGGYNEFIHTYGWDDSDLYDRLEKAGLKKSDINNDYVQHFEHSDSIRGVSDTFQSIQVNRLLCEIIQWGAKFPMSEFDMVRAGIYKAKWLNTPDPYILEKAKAAYRKSYPDKIWVEPKKFFVRVRNGLGNRLRALASIYNLFRRFPSGWNMVIIWEKDEHCGAEWTDLFEPIKFIFLDKMPLNPFDPCNHVSILKTEFCHSGHDSLEADDFLDHIQNYNFAYIESSAIINHRGYNWKDDCKFLRSLKPIKSIADELIRQPDMSNVVGVHIRLGQDLICDDVSSWSVKKQEEWKKHRAASSTNVFIKKMKTYPSSQRFFIASDSPRAYNLMVQEFGHRVMFIKRNLWDRSAEQTQFALMDVLLLSKCKEVLGSNWSSFTELVTRMGDTKVYLAGKDFLP